MKMRLTLPTTLMAVLAGATLAFAGQNVLKNGSMENGDGTTVTIPSQAEYWSFFGNTIERTDTMNLVPLDGQHALKAFSGSPGTGAYQDIAVVSGDMVTISASLYTLSTDQISGDAQAGLRLEFLDENYGQISSESTFVLTESSPADTWIPASIGPIEAPAGVAYARIVCIWEWFSTAGGSGFWDDAQLSVNGSVNLLLNGDFEEAHVTAANPFGIGDWTGFNDQGKSEDLSLHGDSSLKIGMGAEYSGLFQDFGTLNAGDRILLKAKAYQPSTDPLATDDRVGLKLEFFAVPGSELPPPVENLPFTQDTTSNAWILVNLSTNGVVIPDGINQARIVMLYYGDDTATGSVHFDSAYAELDSSPGTNLLQNPSFEDGDGGDNGIDYWNEFNTPGVSFAQKSVFEVAAYDGWATMKAHGNNWAGIWQDVSVTPGDELSLSVYMYTDSSDEFISSNGLAGVKVEWIGGTVPGPVDIGSAADDHTVTGSSPTDQWIDLVIDYTMPAGSQAVGRFVNLAARGSGVDGFVYIDNCEAVVVNRFDGADADGDDDADLEDFAAFQSCYTGDGVTPLPWNCTVFDSDEDDDVDLIDWAYVGPRITGPAIPE